MSAFAASMRNFGFDVRAGGPRRSQASSLRTSCGGARRGPPRCGRARRGRGRRPRSRPRTGGRRRRTTSHVAVQTASRNQRSCVTTSSEPRRAARWRASQSTPSTSRWFVGSSRRSSSGPSSSVRASAILRRSPPDSVPIRVSRPSGKRVTATPPSRPSSTPRNAASLAHSWSARPPTSSSRTVLRGIEVVALPEQRELRGRASRMSAPASGSSRPAMSRSSVDLPSPLRPTTPMRSPAATPSVTSCRTVRAA